MNRFPRTFDTQVFEQRDGIRQRETRYVRLNTEFHRPLGCLLSLHKIHVDPATTTDEAADFWHRYQEITSPHFSRVTKHDLSEDRPE